jgi:hypothetical protein
LISTLIGVVLVIAHDHFVLDLVHVAAIFWKSSCFRSAITSNALPIFSFSVSSFGVWSMRSSPTNCVPPFESD